MLITEGFGDNQLLITEGFGTSVSLLGADRPLGDRIIQAKQMGTPRIIGDRLSDRGRVFDMEEAV